MALVSILAVWEQPAGHTGVVVGTGVTVLAVGPKTTSLRETTEATPTRIVLFIVCMQKETLIPEFIKQFRCRVTD